MSIIKPLLGSFLFFSLTTSLCVASPAGKTQQFTAPDQVPEGLAKSDWASIRAAYEAGRHAFLPIAGGWQARNSGQQWTTRFDGRGFVSAPKDGGWHWGLELKRYGFPGAEREVGGVSAVQAAGPRLTYAWDTALTEWFLNRPAWPGARLHRAHPAAPRRCGHLATVNARLSDRRARFARASPHGGRQGAGVLRRHGRAGGQLLWPEGVGCRWQNPSVPFCAAGPAPAGVAHVIGG